MGHVSVGGLEVVTKANEIRTSSERIVLLDEGYATFGGFTVYYDRSSWWDLPPTRYDNGVTVGYADGRSGFFKWKDKRTIT